MKLLTTETFIAKAVLIHGNIYEYDLINYKTNNKKVIIKCSLHGYFEQLPRNHLGGRGCHVCAQLERIKSLSSNAEEFIKKAKAIHTDEYIYDSVDYKNNKTDVIIICKKHGEFKQTPNNHTNYEQGCPSCYGGKQIDTAEFIKRAIKKHGKLYAYFSTNYKNMHDDVEIVCSVHGSFWQSPDSHLRGFGCRRCSRVYCLEDFVKKANEIHKFKYNYSKTNYKESNSKVEIICVEHGSFWQTPNNHLGGHGCSMCLNKNEQLVSEVLADLKIHYLRCKDNKLIINGKKFYPDFFIPLFNLIIEYNGAQHYEPICFNNISKEKANKKFLNQLIRDDLLRGYCKENNINLLEIDGRLYRGEMLKEFLQNYFRAAA
jgi:hypothetical protein